MQEGDLKTIEGFLQTLQQIERIQQQLFELHDDILESALLFMANRTRTHRHRGTSLY